MGKELLAKQEVNTTLSALWAHVNAIDEETSPTNAAEELKLLLREHEARLNRFFETIRSMEHRLRLACSANLNRD